MSNVINYHSIFFRNGKYITHFNFSFVMIHLLSDVIKKDFYFTSTGGCADGAVESGLEWEIEFQLGTLDSFTWIHAFGKVWIQLNPTTEG